MTESLVPAISAFLERYLSPEIIVFVVSLLPILELRGGLIVAKLLGVPLLTAIPIAVIANALPVPFIIFFIERILGFLKEHGPIKKFARWIEEKGKRAGAKLQGEHSKSLWVGLFLFVAIPLPGTGAWTGSLAAALLGLSPKKSMIPIFCGILGACVIMSIVAYAIPGAFGL
ncbi:small multi-drug export protein [Ruminococcaceae bacterium OttesenSCG-928-A11]|nr:small multi-drug export protein [Ruminococcaceae bacterium OttesenSCG-928-A11]